MAKGEHNEFAPYPLFKGATRQATFLGVPTTPLLVMFISVGAVSLVTSLFVWAAAPVLWFGMAQITKYDDKAFRVLWLWFETKGRNRNTGFWKASSYSPVDYRKRR